ncbi:hypothetical protein CPB85DRAFT_1300820 [Mucidula mucida]|nr:hypothetical protein CPB85DRAFT_1300820 [Mucidula mucida]
MSYRSSATLPQELIDLIVEQLRLDRDGKSLIACLTVSKGFFPMARACLWRDRFLRPYRISSRLGPIKWSLNRIPEASVVRSLVRSMRLSAENWAFKDIDSFWQDHRILVDAFERVNDVQLDFSEPFGRIPVSPAIGKWCIVSLEVSFLKLAPREVVHASANACAFFEHFPMLNHLELRHLGYIDADSDPTLCTATRHDKLPEPVSLTLIHVFNTPVCSIILAGHMFSLKKLRTLEIHSIKCPPEAQLLLEAVSDTVKELVVHVRSNGGHPFLFHCAESILFSLDTHYGAAREMLLWWILVMVQNNSNNTVQRVTIEIQIHLTPELRRPKICFPKVWTEFGMALGGLLALQELVIIYKPGHTERIGNKDDVATRARVTKFLRGKLSAILDPARVRLVFIDRNV